MTDQTPTGWICEIDHENGPFRYCHVKGCTWTESSAVDASAPTALTTRDAVFAYSEWLDGQGLVAPDHHEGSDPRTHDDLASEFMAGWVALHPERGHEPVPRVSWGYLYEPPSTEGVTE